MQKRRQVRCAENAKKGPFIAIRKARPAASKEIPMETWENHFQEILNQKNKNITLEASTGDVADLHAPITRDEITKTLRIAKTKKAVGTNGIYGEQASRNARFLLNLFNKYLSTGTISEAW